MGKFVFVYTGGGGAPTSEEEGKMVMDAWMSWFGSMGAAVLDGGNPFGACTTVSANGNKSGGSGVSGYSIVSADSLEGAAALAKGCPLLGAGGAVEVYETIDM